MAEYVIVTDSSCDFGPDMVERLGLAVAPLRFTMDGVTYENHPDERDMPAKVFYDRMRAGEAATTSAANISDWREVVEPILKEGKDALVIPFSSGLSSSCNNALLACEELREEYPQRKVLWVDSLCESLGLGLLVYLTAQKQRSGATIEEAAKYAEETRAGLCHWFTVDDLKYLKRGGRVSGTAAALGTVLSIKPVLHMDDEGHLVSMAKARGRDKSISAIVEHMAQLAVEPEGQTVFICHGDCEGDAEKLKGLIQDRFGIPNEKFYIHTIGPVIGAHSGPGTLAAFFLGSKR